MQCNVPREQNVPRHILRLPRQKASPPKHLVAPATKHLGAQDGKHSQGEPRRLRGTGDNVLRVVIRLTRDVKGERRKGADLARIR